MTVGKDTQRLVKIRHSVNGMDRVVIQVILYELRQPNVNNGREEVTRALLPLQAHKGTPADVNLRLPGDYAEIDGVPQEVINSDYRRKDPYGSNGQRGVRATQRVRIEEREDHDHIWVFPGFKVRSSKLLPILWAFRDAGIEDIDTKMIQRALQRY